MNKLNIKQIADMAKISAGTVSRVLTGRNDVNRETRMKIISIMKETGFIPQVATSTRKAIALLQSQDALNNDSPFNKQASAGMFQASFKLDYDLIIMPIPENTAEFDENLYLSVLRKGVQGVVMHQPLAEAGLEKIFQKTPIKCVVYQGRSPCDDFGWVDHDNYEIMQKTLYTFKDYGYCKVFFVGPRSQFNESVKERFRACEDFAKRENFEIVFIETKGLGEERLVIMFQELLNDATHGAFGIIGPNSDFVNPLYSALLRSRIDPIGKVGIVATDNGSYYPCLNPPLSSIEHPYFETGMKAVEMLIGMINGNGAGRINLPSRLNIRKSLMAAKAPFYKE